MHDFFLFVNVTIWNALHSVKLFRKADVYEKNTRKQVVNSFQSILPAFTYGKSQ